MNDVINIGILLILIVFGIAQFREIYLRDKERER